MDFWNPNQSSWTFGVGLMRRKRGAKPMRSASVATRCGINRTPRHLESVEVEKG